MLNWRCTLARIMGASLAALMIGCGSDEAGPNSPGSGLEFSDYWPVSEPATWEYSLDYLVGDPSGVDRYDRREDVPELPGLDELYAELQVAIDWTDETVRHGSLSLVLDDVEQLSSGTASGVLTSTTTGVDEQPWLLHDCLLKLEDDRIAGYETWLGNTVPDLYCVYLTTEMAVGTELSAQLLPSWYWSEPLVLRFKVTRELTVNLSGTEVRCVEVVYSLDLGVCGQATHDGQQEVYYRGYYAGTVIYGAGIGPIQNHEHRVFWNVIQTSQNSFVEDIFAELN